MITKININILTEDEFKITEEDLAELNRVLQNEHLQSFFIACNVLKVNENYINIIKKELLIM